MWGHRNIREALAVGRPRLIAQLVVECVDGSVQQVVSDESWRVTEGPVRFNSIYLGEIHDARMELPGWDLPGFDDSEWRAATRAPEVVGRLEAQPQPPIRVVERFPAVQRTEPAPGVFIYDLGRNFSGWASLRFMESEGARIVLRYGELLNPDGSLNPLTSVCGQIKGTDRNSAASTNDLGGPGPPTVAWQTDTYIARGTGEESYRPRFTFHGFRYVEVTGLSRPLPLEAVEGFQLASDVPEVGTFMCSHKLLNEIQQMCQRTFRANLYSVQSDCPHRERFAYGGDIVATREALMMNFDMAAFYAKTVRDWADAARPEGTLTDTAPFVGIHYCGVGWAMVHPILLRDLYRYYGERQLLAEQFPVARRWLLGLADKYPEGVILKGLSDHEALTPTPAPLLVTPLYYQSALLLAELATIIGATTDADHFTALAESIQQVYQEQFVDISTGQVGPGTQTSQSFALFSELLPTAAQPKALALLLDDIHTRHDGHLTTGIMGTQFMLDVLSRNGHADTAYGVATRTNYPGWGWMLANGATTLWERWAMSTNTYTHNHPMFGSVSQWLIQWLGGIQPDPQAIGFDRIIIQPQPVPNLSWVRSSYNSVRGQIISNWSRQDGRLHFEIQIPPNTQARLHLPAKTGDPIKEGGVPLEELSEISVFERDGKSVVLGIGSGHYLFELVGP
jgi:alpha-L-rhamnosidase